MDYKNAMKLLIKTVKRFTNERLHIYAEEFCKYMSPLSNIRLVDRHMEFTSRGIIEEGISIAKSMKDGEVDVEEYKDEASFTSSDEKYAWSNHY